MKPVLIIENNTNPLRMNEGVDARKDYLLGGTFTEFMVKNRNERVYTPERFLPCLEELNTRITTMGVVYGEFDHPDVFDTSLSRASHLIKTAYYVKEKNVVEGQIKLLNTYWGKEAKALVDDGCPIFVSSRAAGITEADGTVSLKKLFTYDIVADPGFASARMSSINESLNYSNEANFRIYEVSNESKINELFNMNKNEFVTKDQLSDYSKYIVNEIAATKKEVKSALKSGNLEPAKLEKLLNYYEELNKTNSQVVKYLDYLAEKIQVVVSENKSLKDTTDRLIEHNDYLVENLNKSIKYSEYVAENLDKNIAYAEYIAENLDKNISYSEYIAENLDRNISYSEYIAENLDKNISYSEYIAENVDKNISYAEYLAENLDRNISYAEYLAENLDGNIAYSEYIAENLEGNIKYSEYIAEHLDDNISYSQYIAENLDKAVSYTGLISEKVNGTKLFESNESNLIPTLEEFGFGENDVEAKSDNYLAGGEDELHGEDGIEKAGEADEATPVSLDYTELTEIELPEEQKVDTAVPDEADIEDELLGKEVKLEDLPEVPKADEEYLTHENKNTDSDLSKKIDLLIEEARKRKVSETNDLHFLKFLNKSQVDSYYSLTNEEQEQVKLYINEKSYFTSSEVIKLIQEALSIKNESLEERLIRLMPENIKSIWEVTNESSKKSILSQAKLYPELDSEAKIEHFWLTRNLKKNESTKKMISHDSLIQEDKLSDSDFKSILERFKNI
jgi:hypothetical protein